MAKSTRDTLKQLVAGYVKDLYMAGMKVTQMMLLYGDDYPEYRDLCKQHQSAVAGLHDLALELQSKV